MPRSLFLLLLVAPLAAQTRFEGNVSMTITGDDGVSHPFTYQLKDGKMRMDISGRGGMSVGMIFDPGTSKMTVILPMQKMYMEQDVGAAIEAAKAQSVTGGKAATVVRTGKMETIAGYKCEHISISGTDAPYDVCATSELGAFRMPGMGNPMAPSAGPAWVAQLGGNTFPLKVQKGDKVILEVNAVDKKTLDPALFAPPAGFQEMKMPGGTGGMRPPQF
jgi:hypothetical protein